MGRVKKVSHSTSGHIVASLAAGALTMGVAAAIGKLWKNNPLKFWEIGLGMTAVNTALTFTALHLTLRDDPTKTQPSSTPKKSEKPVHSLRSSKSATPTPKSSSSSDSPEASTKKSASSASSTDSDSDDFLKAVGGEDDIPDEKVPPQSSDKGRTGTPIPSGSPSIDHPLAQPQDPYFGAGKDEWTKMSKIEKETQKQVYLASLQSGGPPADSDLASALAASLQDQQHGPIQDAIQQSKKAEEERQECLRREEEELLAAVIAMSQQSTSTVLPPQADDSEEISSSSTASSSTESKSPVPSGQTLGSDARAETPTWLAERQRRMRELEAAKKTAAVATGPKVEEPAKQERRELRGRRPAPVKKAPAKATGLTFGSVGRKKEKKEAPVESLTVSYTRGQSLTPSAARHLHISNAEQVKAHTGPLEVPIEVVDQLADLGELKASDLTITSEGTPTPEQLQHVVAVAAAKPVILKTAELTLPNDESLGDEQVATLINVSPYLETVTMTPEQAEVVLPALKALQHDLVTVKIVGGAAITGAQASTWVEQGLVDEISLDLTACGAVSPETVVAFNRAQGMNLVIPDGTDLSHIRTNNLELVMANLMGFGDDVVREQYTGPVSYTPLVSSDGRVLIRQGTHVIDSETAHLMLQWVAAEEERSLTNMPNADGVRTVYLDDIPLLTQAQLDAIIEAFPNATTISHERCYGLEASDAATDSGKSLSRLMRQEFRKTGRLNPYVNGDVSPTDAVKALIKVNSHATHGKARLMPQIQTALKAKEADTQKKFEERVFEYEKLQRQCIEYLCRAITPETIDAIWKCAEDNEIGVLRAACYLTAKACGLDNAEDFECDPTTRECSDFVFELDGRERPFQRWMLARSPWMRDYFLCPTKQSASGGIEEGLYYTHKALRHIPDRDRGSAELFNRSMNFIADYLEGSLDIEALSDAEANALIPATSVHRFEDLRAALLRKLNIPSYEGWLGRNLSSDG